MELQKGDKKGQVDQRRIDLLVWVRDKNAHRKKLSLSSGKRGGGICLSAFVWVCVSEDSETRFCHEQDIWFFQTHELNLDQVAKRRAKPVFF